MRKVVIAGGVVLLVLLAALLVVTWRVSRFEFDETLQGDPSDRLMIAPLDQALTLARVDSVRSR